MRRHMAERLTVQPDSYSSRNVTLCPNDDLVTELIRPGPTFGYCPSIFLQHRRVPKTSVGTRDACGWAEINPLKPNDPYSGRTAPLTSKRCISYIYSTNMGTEYFKHAIYSPFFLFKMQFVS